MTERMSRPQPPSIRHAMPSAPTYQLELTPAFKEALRQVAPKPRRRLLPYFVALGIVALVAGIAFPSGGRSASAAASAAAKQIAETTSAITAEPAPAPQAAQAQIAQAAAPIELPASEASPAATCAPNGEDEGSNAATDQADDSAPVVEVEQNAAPAPTPVVEVSPAATDAPAVAKKAKKTPRKSHRRARW